MGLNLSGLSSPVWCALSTPTPGKIKMTTGMQRSPLPGFYHSKFSDYVANHKLLYPVVFPHSRPASRQTGQGCPQLSDNAPGGNHLPSNVCSLLPFLSFLACFFSSSGGSWKGSWWARSTSCTVASSRSSVVLSSWMGLMLLFPTELGVEILG